MSRRQQLEELLKTNPGDAFLRYGLALECAKEGNVEEGLARLRALITDQPDYIAAYFQAAQLLVQQDRTAEAQRMLQAGVTAAQRRGDVHAAEEMQSLLMQLPGPGGEG